MRTFLTILKSNYLRTLPRIVPVLVMTLVTLGSMLLAVYITRQQQVQAHVVFIRAAASQAAPQSSNTVDVTVAAQKPPVSDLIRQKYDAYITPLADGNLQIDTLRGNDFKSMLLLLLRHPNAPVGNNKTQRGVGVNIIGFMMMFLLMVSFSNLFAFADDKEQGQLRRIAASPASFPGYLAAHAVYCLSLLLPEFAMLAVLKACGWNIGFTLPQYAGLMAMLGFLGFSFALLLHTLLAKPDNADMLGNAVTVLASVLAGGFYSFTKQNAVMDGLTGLLPQKQAMNFAQALQNGDAWQHGGSVAYVAAFSLALFAISCMILRQMYVKKPKNAHTACQANPVGLQ